MTAEAVHDSSVFLDGVETGDAESSKLDLVVEVSSNGDMKRELGAAGDFLTRLELDLDCISEKLVNLNVLTMHVATKENDLDTFMLDRECMPADSVKALEFDLLSAVLDSEVTEVDDFLKNLQTDISGVGGILHSYSEYGEVFVEMEEKLRESVESMKQSFEQVSEIREQSDKFQRILSCLSREENRNGTRGPNFLGDGQNSDTKINMHTVDQQRHILRMLEKSLARDIDLEKKLTESKQIEEELRCRLISAEQEVFFTEEEALDVCERCFEAENVSEVLMGISKEQLSRLQIIQFNLNGAIQREEELKSKLKRSVEKLEAKENALQKFNSSSSRLNDFLIAQADNLKASLTEAENRLIITNSEVFTLREKINLLENQLKDYEFKLFNGNQEHDIIHPEYEEMENMIEDLREKLLKTEGREENAKAKCKLLEETNMELNEELGTLKGTTEKIDLLERQLKESDIKLQHAVVSVEASQEHQSMLNYTIKDMENLIEDLKSKVLKAESRADNAEAKCLSLSESNAKLSEKLGFFRGRLECIEASFSQAEEKKMETARDIGFQTKIITDLVMRLTVERERLQKQMSALALENRTLVVKLQQPQKDLLFSENEFKQKSDIGPEKKVPASESKEEAADSVSNLETVRRIDAGQLSFKHVFIALLILLISAVAYTFLSEDRPL
ncbi:hypothetical protein K2173_020179 [Erythroxylum novogranatense]|uniref:WIT1/2 N-terminal helical bundle domain-containing protein n=1 Tax=Erythroxylum novogranatense TaxID=1862640 RepID=A0AAV8UA11_9ROSI|nr:hypothetical protein K2173_020179 [Erythroxylum novogranatense]